MSGSTTYRQPVPGHNRRLYTDEQLAEAAKQPSPWWSRPGTRKMSRRQFDEIQKRKARKA